jgi:hypothetical protein
VQLGTGGLMNYYNKQEKFVRIDVVDFSPIEKKYLVEWFINKDDQSSDEDFYTYKKDALESYKTTKQRIDNGNA